MKKVLIEMTERQHEIIQRYLDESIPETWPEGFESAREWSWKKTEYDIAQFAFQAFRNNVYKKGTV